MIERKSGHIVTISSSAGKTGVSHLTDYCASKYAARGFDSSLRRELMDLGGLHKCIKLTCVSPYFINTGMFEGATSSTDLMHKSMGCYFLEPDYVCQEIYDAIRYEKRDVTLPPELGGALSLEHFLPFWFQDWATVTACDMRAFVGRHAKH